MAARTHRSRAILSDRSGGRNGRDAPSTRGEVSGSHTRNGHSDDRMLAEALRLIVSDPPAEVSRRHVLDALMSVAGVRGALAYEWDAADELLRLAASSPVTHRVAGEDTYRLGEGAVGRAALAPERPVSAPIALVGAPRGSARLVPLGARGSITAIRLAASDDRLSGVLAVVGTATDHEAVGRILADMSLLLAHALDIRRGRQADRRRAELLGAIEILARSVSAEASLAETLDAIARLALRSTAARACAVYVAERSRGELRLAVVAPRDAGAPPIWRLDDRDGTRPAATEAARRTEREKPEATIVRPAIAGAQRLGALVLFGAGDENAHEGTALAERLARVLSVALRQRQLLDASADRTRAEDLLWEILGVGGYAEPTALLARARRLGCDLGQARVVVVGSAPSGEEALRLRAAILTADPCAIADVGGDQVVAVVAPVALERVRRAGSWSMGASQPVSDLRRYPAAYREAQDALELGARLFGSGRLVRSEDLGSYRFVPALVQAGLRSGPEYEQVSRLSDELLRTLEAYLDNGGNTAIAARHLYLHRNTLRQRLERISATLELDVAAPERWLALQLAIKTARMSRLESAPARPAAT